MNSRRTGLPPRHLTAVSSRAADARALKAAIAGSTKTKQEDPEAQRHVPSFLMANPPAPAAAPAPAESPAPTAAAAPASASPPALLSPPTLASLPEPLPQKSREALIAEEAYLRAAGRGFEPGHELDDWLAAERMVDAQLAGKPAP